ncbi:MAG: thiamine pyrophosphate-binding protein [Gammaproteobacteria bacterium]|nr:thiamine pyrophosphate-binding protein [Gammaproteobacteria bacterium]
MTELLQEGAGLCVSGAELILRRVAEAGSRHVFLVPGAHIYPLVKALTSGNLAAPIIAAHELGAGFMADGYARLSGRPGVCASIGGPGASNMLTAAVTAQADRSPVLFLSGNVPCSLQGKGLFQDGGPHGSRDVALFSQVVECAAEVNTLEALEANLARAMEALEDTPPKPAFLSIPVDVLAASVVPGRRKEPGPQPAIFDHGALALAMGDFLRGTLKVAILAGEEVARGQGAALLKEFAERYQVPVATTFAAKGAVPEDHRLSLGNFGYGGARRASTALLSEELEALLVLGAEFSERNTLCWHPALLPPGRRVLRIAATPQPPQAPVSPEFRADCAQVLDYLLKEGAPALAPLENGHAIRQQWLERLAAEPFAFDLPTLAEDASGIHPGWVVHEMRRYLPRETALFVDAGTHRLYAGHYWRGFTPGSLVTANRTGPMGWAIAAAIGGKLARPDLPVAAFTGDGCMLMHGLELATAVRYRVPIIYIVSNNRGYGKIYMAQQASAPAAAALSRLERQDWAKFATNLGATGYSVSRLDQLGPALQRAQAADGPVVIDVLTMLECAPPEQSHAASALYPGPLFTPEKAPLAENRNG